MLGTILPLVLVVTCPGAPPLGARSSGTHLARPTAHSHSASPGPLAADADDVPLLAVGDRAVKGSRIEAFDANWVNLQDVTIHEVADIEKRDGKKRLVRVQTWPLGGGVAIRSELVLDPKTLATVSFEQRVDGLPEGASIGRPTRLRWDFDGKRYTRTVEPDPGAEPVVTEGELPNPMFEGSALGLVIAALPLELDYEARLPVAMNLQLAEEHTLYHVRVRVTGEEEFAWKRGKRVSAWVVEVDWEDYDTGAVTSVGGALEPGGAYFVVPKPPKGFPHVPRYQNDTTTIDLVVDG